MIDYSDEFILFGAENNDPALDNNPNPWESEATGPNICKRINLLGTENDACVNTDAATRLFGLLSGVETWQREGLNLKNILGLTNLFAYANSDDRYCDADPNLPPPPSRTSRCENNPADTDCVICPGQFAITATNSFGVRPSGAAAITARPHDMNSTTSVFDSARSIETLLHEYFHVMQAKVGFGPSWNSESTARAIGPNGTLLNIPGSRGAYVSAGKLKALSDFDEGRFYRNPRNNTFDDK